MKYCPTCDDVLSDIEFSKDAGRRGGLAYCCKRCFAVRSRRYYEKNTEALKAKTRAYLKTERGKEVDAKSQFKWRKTPSGIAFSREDRRRNFLKYQARGAIHTAKVAGRLTPGPCVECGTTKNIEAHHHNGYAKEHWLDVQWLCREHHVE